MISHPLQPTWLEIATGKAVGECHKSLPTFRPYEPAENPRRSLERSVASALRKPPCYVGFTGGRDSSALLALAMHVARREDLPLPIPLTIRFLGIPSADESSWQELMVRHLGVNDWVKVEVDSTAGDFDLVGPRAQTILARHGLLWPPNVVMFSAFLEAARGGALVTGIDADGLFGRWQWVGAGDVLAGRRLPRVADVANLSLFASPQAVRELIAVQRSLRAAADPTAPRLLGKATPVVWAVPWLQPDVRDFFIRLQAADQTRAPRSWNRWVGWWAKRRHLAMLQWSMQLVADDVELCHPFLDPGFLHSVAVRGGVTGYGDRQAIMRALFTDLLPEEVLARTTKAATFARLCWSKHTLRFIDEWDGTGLDPEVFDLDALVEEWRRPHPHEGSALSLQAAWLATRKVRPAGQVGT